MLCLHLACQMVYGGWFTHAIFPSRLPSAALAAEPLRKCSRSSMNSSGQPRATAVLRLYSKHGELLPPSPGMPASSQGR